MARPTKLDSRTQSLIIAGIQLGLTYEAAAEAAGIGTSTFYAWQQRGREAKSGKFREFLEALTRAKAQAQVTLAKTILDAAKGGRMLKEVRTRTLPDGTTETTTIEREASPDWRAALTILERRYIEDWGRRDSLKLEVDWKQELTQMGIDPDAAIDYTTELLKALADGEASVVERSDAEITV